MDVVVVEGPLSYAENKTVVDRAVAARPLFADRLDDRARTILAFLVLPGAGVSVDEVGGTY